jgi:hypothetical protein
MMDQINIESKTDQKRKAIASLLIGIISTIPLIQLLSSGMSLWFLSKGMASLSFLSIIGVILGIKGLKSTTKKFAIGGIVFSIIGFFGLLFIIYTAWISYMQSAW